MTKVFGYFLKSFRVTYLVIATLGFAGIFTAFNLPQESTPEINVPFAGVVTAYPGSSARDVEELITNKVENAVENLEGVKKVTSSSRIGISNVNIEFFAEEDLDEAIDRVREAVDTITGLPADAEDPFVIELNFSNEPILLLGLSGDIDNSLLAEYADILAEDIRSVTGISDVVIVGDRTEEVIVRVDPERLNEFGVSISQIFGAIRTANTTTPVGQIETTNFSYDIRIAGRFEDIGDISDIQINTQEGIAPLSNLADITLELNETRSSSQISVNGEDPTPAVTLQLFKKTGGNIVDIVDESITIAEEAIGTTIPDSVQLSVFNDRADDIRSSLRDVTRSGIQTFIIVLVMLSLFLGWRAAIVASTAIPLTFFVSFIVFEATNTTLNGISLFALILSLGLLVDNAIVIIEGVYEKHSNLPSSLTTQERDTALREKAFTTIKQFQKPLAAGTLTTVAAFFPMLLVSGIIGEFLKVIPIVVSATLVASLFVALAFMPPVAVSLLRSQPPLPKDRWFNQQFEKLKSWYEKIINRALTKRRFQNIFIATLIILLVVGFALPIVGLLKTSLFPSADIDFALGNIELPAGSRLERTETVARQVSEILQGIPEITSFSISAGSSASLDIGGGSNSTNLGSYFANLSKDRERSSLEINEELREKFDTIKTATITAEDISAGPPTASPIELRVIGQDLDQLDLLSQDIVRLVDEFPGTVNVDRNLRLSAGEFTYTLDQESLAQFGLSAGDIGQTLRIALFGVDVTSYLDARGEEVDVNLSAHTNTVNSIDSILALPITTPTGETIRLAQVANVELKPSISAILHNDGDRAITISADNTPSTNANEISQQLEEKINTEVSLPAGVRVEFGGEQQETTETFNELYRSMIIAVLLIAIILVVEFNSYRQPFIILLSIPFALIGVLYGLAITGTPLSFATFIGLISLAGIVVNDSILLVDRANALRKQGLAVHDAIRQAATSRLQPIVLTTLTTAGGVAPLIFVDEFFKDMAITIIAGLLFSTVLTLVLIPVLYLRQQQKLTKKTTVS